MENYGLLIAAAVTFVVTHIGFSYPPLRSRLVGGVGQVPFLIAYSLVALAAFGWMLSAYSDAPREYLWIAPTWVRHLPMAVMAVAAILIVAGYTAANPTAVGLDRLARPADGPKGIFRVTRHPILSAIALWAIVHIPASGQASAIIVQFSVGLLAVLGMWQIDRRKARDGGPDWHDYAGRSSAVPFAAILAGRQRLVVSEIGWWRIAAGLGLFAVLFGLHGSVIGVSPLPIP